MIAIKMECNEIAENRYYYPSEQYRILVEILLEVLLFLFKAKGIYNQMIILKRAKTKIGAE